MTYPYPTGLIVYDDTTFKTIFPDFINCSALQCQSWFNRATMICDNSNANPIISSGIGNPVMLQEALYLLTAHIGWLNAPRDLNGGLTAGGANTQAAPSLVGRISSASEGSVSVQTDISGGGGGNASDSPSKGWYMQTRWGAEYWALTLQFRSFQYFATPTRIPQPRNPFHWGWPF